MATVTVAHPSPRFSVVVPAHGATALGRCLQSFVPGLETGEAEVVVVTYGRLDATANVAAAHAGVTVITLDGGTRAGAMNLGDATAHVFPRLYLDSTAVVSVEGLRLLADALTSPGPSVAMPHEHVSGHVDSCLLKAYYAMADGLPRTTGTLLSHGVYGLSEAARARFGHFPDHTDDREFIQTLFATGERAEVREAAFQVDPAPSPQALLTQRARELRAGRDTHTDGEALAGDPRPTGQQLGQLARAVRRRPARMGHALVYAALEGLAGLRSHRATGAPETANDAQRDSAAVAGSRAVVDGVAFDRVTESEVIERVLGDLSLGRGGLILTPNVDILRQLRQPRDADLVYHARLVVADGAPIVWASRVLGDPLPERVTGASLIWSLSGAAASAGHQVMLVGGDHGVAERAAGRLEDRHPDLLRVPWHFPPFGFDVEEGGLEGVVEAIAAEKASIVFLGLGFPRQERLAVRLAAEFPGTWFVGCGGSITMLAGDRTRAPRWMQAAGLEWFHRLVQEPRRLFRRYLVDDVPFAVAMLSRAAGQRLRRRTAPVAQAAPVRLTMPSPTPRPRTPMVDLRNAPALTRAR